MENVLQILSETLTSNHSIILDFKHKLIAMYQSVQLDEKSYERKLKLCRELIDVLCVIEPDISRLTGTFCL